APGGASFARLCSACSTATMRGADSSHVRLFADSRYQIQPTFPGLRRAASIADFHDAWVCRWPMTIIFGLGLTYVLLWLNCPSRSCGIGACGVPRPILGDYVAETGPRGAADAAGEC